jgi:CheY-like chemotaxis protein/HPt (histidine-containing phosphotransfer) domain-containing protein
MPKGEPFNRLPVVLLIDDDMVSREVAATLMTMSEYIVYTAENGNAAVEMLGREGFAPDAILMDAQMPGLSGTALIAALRACTKTPIYAISGSNPPPEVVAAADGFLLKPFDLSAFRKLLAGEARNVAASALDANAPVIQAETLAQFRRLMPEAAVRQVYSMLASDLVRRIGALERAIDQGDAVEVRRIGHAIKGGCGMAGALQAAHLGALLEAQDNHLNNSATLLRDLRAAAFSLERMLEVESLA